MRQTFRDTLRMSRLSAPRSTLQNRGTLLARGRPPLLFRSRAFRSLVQGLLGSAPASSSSLQPTDSKLPLLQGTPTDARQIACHLQVGRIEHSIQIQLD